MTRFCPNCHAVVPDNSLTCPSCYTEVPREGWTEETDEMGYSPSRTEYRNNIRKRRKNPALVLMLAVIPAFFGILGLGQIYCDHRRMRGWAFLAGGLVLALASAGLLFFTILTGPLGLLIAVPFGITLLLYICLALVSVLDAVTGSIIRLGVRNRFRLCISDMESAYNLIF